MTPLVIDCDPGQDDAVALMLALASAELEVLGVTVAAGNVGLEHTVPNALRVAEFADRSDLKVFAGCERPLRRPLEKAVRIHGAHGLHGLDLPAPRMAVQPAHATEFIVETARARGDVTLCALGPLTNVAMAFAKAPDIARRLGQIVLMGGARGGLIGGAWRGGNTNPVAEFNMFTDPDAAAVVFAGGAPIVQIGLDVTHKVLVTPERLLALRDRGGRAGAAVAGMYDRPDRYAPERYGSDGLPLHDPCVIAYVLRPELFAGRHCNVMVETESDLTRGQTVVDWWGRTGRPPNALVLDHVDVDGFFELLIERLARL